MQNNTAISKIMIILWHWKELNQRRDSSDIISVENSSFKKIIRIDETVGKEQANCIEDIIFEHCHQYHKNDELIIFYHEGSITKKQVANIKNLLKEKKAIPEVKLLAFGGGNCYLYYKPKLDTGLIDRSNSFPMGKKTKKWTDPLTGEKKRAKISIVNNQADGTYKVQEKYFDQVWKYYHVEPKKKIFEFKEHLFIYLIGNQSTTPQHLKKVLQEHHTLKPLFDDFLSLSWKNRPLSDLYGAEQLEELDNQYTAINRLIEHRPLEGNYLTVLRNHFKTLLIQMPEKIYE